MTAVILGLIGSVLLTVLALPVTKYVLKGWVMLFTMPAPEEVREARREEVLSDLHDEVVDLRAQGLASVEIAARIVFRMVRGAKDDVAVFAPYYPAALAESLERGSKAIGRFRTPTELIASLAALGFVNCSYLASDSNQPLVELPLINVGVLMVSALIWNQHHPWARRMLNGLMGLCCLLAAAVFTWLTVEHRLYEVPNFHQFASQFALLALSMVFIWLVGTNWFRSRVFGERWWPVFLCWPLIVATSIGVVTMAGWDPTMLITGWVMAGLLLLVWTIAAAIFALGAAGVWYGGLKVSAYSMRLVAAAIRRLD